MRAWRTAAFLALTLTAAPAMAMAQDNELGGGLTIQKWNSTFAGSKGFGIDFARTIRKSDTHALAVVVDFARNRFSHEETDTSITAGVRLKLIRSQRLALFVQGLVGMMMWAEDDFDFFGTTIPGDSGRQAMFGGGGGAQVRLTDMVDVKGQLDLFASDGDLITRIWAGVVVKLGAK